MDQKDFCLKDKKENVTDTKPLNGYWKRNVIKNKYINYIYQILFWLVYMIKKKKKKKPGSPTFDALTIFFGKKKHAN